MVDRYVPLASVNAKDKTLAGLKVICAQDGAFLPPARFAVPVLLALGPCAALFWQRGGATARTGALVALGVSLLAGGVLSTAAGGRLMLNSRDGVARWLSDKALQEGWMKHRRTRQDEVWQRIAWMPEDLKPMSPRQAGYPLAYRFRGAGQFLSQFVGRKFGVVNQTVVVEASAALTILLYLICLRFAGAWNQTSSTSGVFWSVLTGICVGVGTVFFFILFQKGGPLSAVPMILAGGAALMALAGS